MIPNVNCYPVFIFAIPNVPKFFFQLIIIHSFFFLYSYGVHLHIYFWSEHSKHCVLVIINNTITTVVHQSFKLQVYDEFVIKENMAIMRCHIPSIVRDYVRIVAWLRDDHILVTASHNPRKLIFIFFFFIFSNISI